MDSIGFFQLENLIVSRSTFVFLDVGTDGSEVLPEPLDKYVKHAVKVEPAGLNDHLTQLAVGKERPIVLISQTEAKSAVAAQALEAAGYTNVYIIEGGVVGLLSEL